MTRTPKNKTEKGEEIVNSPVQKIVPEIPSEKPKGEPLLKRVFEGARIVALAGATSSGKTNAIMYLLKNYREYNKTTEILIYGVQPAVMKWASENLGATEISSLDHISDRDNSIFYLDECHLLGLNDRKNNEQIQAFAAFIAHANNYCILSSASTRIFNSNLCSVIQKWLLKTVKFESLVNGSDLKRTIQNYRGRYKRLKNVIIPVDKLLVISEAEEVILDIPYMPEIDTKAELPDLFG